MFDNPERTDVEKTALIALISVCDKVTTPSSLPSSSLQCYFADAALASAHSFIPEPAIGELHNKAWALEVERLLTTTDL
jgi:hypothetical protein